jgi:hypothetical protein
MQAGDANCGQVAAVHRPDGSTHRTVQHGTVTNTDADAQRIRVARGCWLEPDHDDDLAARCGAALSVAAADTVISGWSAARLHGLWLPSGPEQITMTTVSPGRVPSQMTRPRRSEVRASRKTVDPDDIEVFNGVPVTNLARTWRDLASQLPLPNLVAAGDSALRSGCTTDELCNIVERTSRSRGSTKARSAIPLLDARSRSRPESHMRVAITDPAIPRFAVNEAVADRYGEWLAEPDLLLAEAKIALEYQGADHADPVRMRKDMTKAFQLRRDGWIVLLYGPAEVFKRPYQIRAEVFYHVRTRTPHLVRTTRGPSKGRVGT